MLKSIKNKMTEIITGTDTKGQESIRIGEDGEARICNILASYGIPYLQNVYIPRKDSGYTEVDILVVHTTGILVIEVKNYNASIKGDISDKNWVATYRGGKQYPMYNPIRQNRGHKIGVEMELRAKYITSGIVVFTGDTVKMDITGKLNPREYIVYEKDLLHVIKKEIKGNKVYTQAEVNTIYNHLKTYTDVGYLTKRKHIYNVKKNKR